MLSDAVETLVRPKTYKQRLWCGRLWAGYVITASYILVGLWSQFNHRPDQKEVRRSPGRPPAPAAFWWRRDMSGTLGCSLFLSIRGAFKNFCSWLHKAALWLQIPQALSSSNSLFPVYFSDFFPSFLLFFTLPFQALLLNLLTKVKREKRERE